MGRWLGVSLACLILLFSILIPIAFVYENNDLTAVQVLLLCAFDLAMFFAGVFIIKIVMRSKYYLLPTVDNTSWILQKTMSTYVIPHGSSFHVKRYCIAGCPIIFPFDSESLWEEYLDRIITVSVAVIVERPYSLFHKCDSKTEKVVERVVVEFENLINIDRAFSKYGKFFILRHRLTLFAKALVVGTPALVTAAYIAYYLPPDKLKKFSTQAEVFVIFLIMAVVSILFFTLSQQLMLSRLHRNKKTVSHLERLSG